MTQTYSPTLLRLLDWEPVCQVPGCFSGHPPATHSITLLPCGCLCLSCSKCARTLKKWGNLMLAEEPKDCRACHRLVTELRVEPLP